MADTIGRVIRQVAAGSASTSNAFADLRALIERHVLYTGSEKGRNLLALWNASVPKFVKVMPKDYKRVLQAIKKAQAAGLTGDDALNAAFEENSKDAARVGGG